MFESEENKQDRLNGRWYRRYALWPRWICNRPVWFMHFYQRDTRYHNYFSVVRLDNETNQPVAPL